MTAHPSAWNGALRKANSLRSSAISQGQAHISTSLVERQNLTMRMSMRRFTRLTNAFSKQIENLQAAVSFHFAHYNFVRMHRTIRMTPAMAAGVDTRLWSLEELVERSSRLGATQCPKCPNAMTPKHLFVVVMNTVSATRLRRSKTCARAQER
jgi:hypothetical protein